MLECEFNPMLGRYHDGELADEQRVAVDNHLRGCPACSGEMEQLRAMSQSLAAVVMPRASAAFLGRLEALAVNVENVMVIRFARRLTAAAAAILIAAASIQFAFHRSAAPVSPSPIQSNALVLSPDERMVIDPESAVSATAGDATSSAADLQVDFVLSGDRQ